VQKAGTICGWRKVKASDGEKPCAWRGLFDNKLERANHRKSVNSEKSKDGDEAFKTQSI
jgi:hypothetical protein